jgi:hypothetical protein
VLLKLPDAGRFGDINRVRAIFRLTDQLKRGTMETSAARSPMLVLFEGRIHPGFTMKDVLKQIFLLQSPGASVLRVTGNDGILTGHIYIHDCTFITGAKVKGSEEVGYDALRTIVMKIRQGSFALLSLQAGDPFESDLSMNIEVRKLAEEFERLPESPTGMFDQSSLLDKVFSPGALPETPQPAKPVPSPASEMQSIFGRVLLAPEEVARPDVNWSAVQPFLGSDPGTSGGFPAMNGARSRESEPLRTTGELRAMASMPKVETQRKIRNLVLTLASVVVFVVIAAGVAWSVRNYLQPPTSQPEAKIDQMQPGNELDVSLSPLKKPQEIPDGRPRSTQQ